MSAKSEQILNLIKAGVNLANSVKEDLQEGRTITDDTITLLNRFMLQHTQLGDLLDRVEASIQTGGPRGEH